MYEIKSGLAFLKAIGKRLLSLDDSDPYCMRLLIDHLALRGREYAQFVQLCTLLGW
jgi:hypothetical protein